MRKLFDLLIVCILPVICYSQDTLRLKEQLKTTKSDFLKVRMIDTVAYMYMLYTNYDTLGEYYGKQALRLAEKSGDKELIAHALFLNARRVRWDATNKEYRNERFRYYISELLKLAKKEQLLYYEAAAYHLQGIFHSNNFQFDQSLQNLNHALLIANSIADDSLIAEIYGIMGETFAERGDKVIAFKNIMLGLYLAEKSKDNTCIGNLRKSLGYFYRKIGDTDKAIENLLIAKEHLMFSRSQEFEPLFWIHIDLAGIYSTIKNFERSREISSEIFSWVQHQPVPQPFLGIAHLSIFLAYFDEENYEEAQAYYVAHPEINKLITAWNFTSMKIWLNAKRFKKQKNYDSSSYYFEKLLPYLKNTARGDFQTQHEVYMEYGEVFLLKKNPQKAIDIFMKNLEVAKRTNLPEYFRDVYGNLDRAYAEAGEFREAYKYRVLYNLYTDSLQGIEKEKELSLLEIENENRRQKQLLLAEEERTRNRHNLQYMAITIAIVFVFTVLIMLGVFTTSTPVIKALGFLAFIMLFEFIILLVDNYIHRVTHGEPWKVMVIKICIIAVLFPFHHYIENKIVHLLVNQKKVSIRGVIFQKKKSPPAVSDPPGGEEGVTYSQ